MVKWRNAKIPLIVVAVAIVAAAALAWRDQDWFSASSAVVALGHDLYVKHCARCHGANLEGQPNWKERLPSGRMPAPPHDATGHTWHHADDDLFLITKKGIAAIVPGYESDMPAFESVLTDDEINAVLAYIRSIWPEREREYQEARSRARE
jgi:mono/diheme cytochrome c family protein